MRPFAYEFRKKLVRKFVLLEDGQTNFFFAEGS